MSAPQSDSIRILLTDCKAQLSVGLYGWERLKPQTVIINVVMEAALTQHYNDTKEDDMDRAINYMPLHDYIIKEMPKLGHIPLLESVAELITNFCFKDARIKRVTVRLQKPEILQDALAGIEIIRYRSV